MAERGGIPASALSPTAWARQLTSPATPFPHRNPLSIQTPVRAVVVLSATLHPSNTPETTRLNSPPFPSRSSRPASTVQRGTSTASALQNCPPCSASTPSTKPLRPCCSSVRPARYTAGGRTCEVWGWLVIGGWRVERVCWLGVYVRKSRGLCWRMGRVKSGWGYRGA